MKKILSRLAFGLLAAGLTLCLAACGEKTAEPVTITLWHVYGGEVDSPLNRFIDEFNQTVGAEQNICVQVGSVSNSGVIHESVLASAYGDPGTTELSDMFVSYPKPCWLCRMRTFWWTTGTILRKRNRAPSSRSLWRRAPSMTGW